MSIRSKIRQSQRIRRSLRQDDERRFIQNNITTDSVCVGEQGLWGLSGNWEIAQTEQDHGKVLYGLSHFLTSNPDYVIPANAIAVDVIMDLNLETANQWNEIDVEAGTFEKKSFTVGELYQFEVQSFWDVDATILADKRTWAFRKLSTLDANERTDPLAFPIHIFCPIVAWNHPDSADSTQTVPSPTISLFLNKNPPQTFSSPHSFFQFSLRTVYMPSDNPAWGSF